MWKQSWEQETLQTPSEFHGPIGWASSEAEARNQKTQLEQDPNLNGRLRISPADAQALAENYWWPQDWPGREAWAISFEDDPYEAWLDEEAALLGQTRQHGEDASFTLGFETR